jgi:transketolase
MSSPLQEWNELAAQLRVDSIRSTTAAGSGHPTSSMSAADLVGEMASLPGISYLRTPRGKTPIIYRPGERFPVGGSKLLRQSDRDRAAIVAAGITMHESLKAYDRLQAEGVPVRVIDAYSVKPIDEETLRRAAADTGGRMVVVEDHWPEGGLGDAVLNAFAGREAKAPTLIKLAVREMPSSGTQTELLHAAGIDADRTVTAVKSLL